jgi:2-C-methyl-D-erythritol 2,4-cyclodiphosphate synthase
MQAHHPCRIGQGFDVHPLVQGRRLVIGGEEIDFDLGLEGHSDADVLCHAVTDALLGAAGLGDIGRHFPDDDPRYKDANSAHLLRHVVGLLDAAGWALVNVDATLIAQIPKFAPHMPKIRSSLALALGVDPERVCIKATTTERMGFTGRGEGIAAMASVTLVAG